MIVHVAPMSSMSPAELLANLILFPATQEKIQAELARRRAQRPWWWPIRIQNMVGGQESEYRKAA